jgi:quercetin dioxygenase-like cupin family protein
MITRRDFIIATVAVFSTTAALALAQTAGKAMLHSNTFAWASFKVEQTKVGERRQVLDGPTPTLANLECHITTLNPGEAPHAPHRHADEEMMLVKEGTLAVFFENRTNIIEAGGVIFAASNELHGLRNIGTSRATYFVVKFQPHDLVK